MEDPPGHRPDPLLFRYGLPLARAWRHLASPADVLAVQYPRPTAADVHARVRTIQSGPPPHPHGWWCAEAARKSVSKAERWARQLMSDEAERRVTNRLLERLASGELAAHGRRGSIADPYMRIEANAWPHFKRPKSWTTGHVEGGGVAFYDVRVFDPLGLPLDLAALAFAPLAVVKESEGLEAEGYPRERDGCLPRPQHGLLTEPFDPSKEQRAEELLRDIRRNLTRLLADGALVATGHDSARGPEAGSAAIGAARWQRAADGGLVLFWGASAFDYSPDSRPVGQCDAQERGYVADVRVHLPTEREPEAQRNVTAGEAPPPAIRKGGRPPKFDRGKIGRELIKLANRPDGLPETAAERRDLVREICKAVSGEEPADSTLAEIMDEFDLR